MKISRRIPPLQYTRRNSQDHQEDQGNVHAVLLSVIKFREILAENGYGLEKYIITSKKRVQIT